MTDQEKVTRLARDVMGWKVREIKRPLILRFTIPGRSQMAWFPKCFADGYTWSPLVSHDSAAEVLASRRLQAPQAFSAYVKALAAIVHAPLKPDDPWPTPPLLLATPAQKMDAVLQCLGLWE